MFYLKVARKFISTLIEYNLGYYLFSSSGLNTSCKFMNHSFLMACPGLVLFPFPFPSLLLTSLVVSSISKTSAGGQLNLRFPLSFLLFWSLIRWRDIRMPWRRPSVGGASAIHQGSHVVLSVVHDVHHQQASFGFV